MNKIEPLLTTEDLLDCVKFIRNKKQEYFVCLSLDSSRRLITRRVVTIGLLDVALVHPREVYAGPLRDRAASIVIVHNHPSGDPTPSKQDIKSTQQLIAAGILLGVKMYDHLIVTKSSYISFNNERLIL